MKFIVVSDRAYDERSPHPMAVREAYIHKPGWEGDKEEVCHRWITELRTLRELVEFVQVAGTRYVDIQEPEDPRDDALWTLHVRDGYYGPTEE